MYQCADNRVQLSDNGQCNFDKVQRHREGHVQLDRGHHPLGERYQMRKLPDLVVHERDICSIHGNITAHTAHRNADIRFFECRRIVYAVADHADGRAF